MTKLPPEEKIYEAWSAISGKRVDIAEGSDRDSGSATVRSSDGTKTYTVKWADSGMRFSSTDNGTRWQHYAGYPVIAILMLQGRVPYATDVAPLFSSVNWTELNARHKGNYAAAVDEAISSCGAPADLVKRLAADAYGCLAALDISVTRDLS